LSESEHSNKILKEQVNQLQSENQRLSTASKSSATLVSAEMYMKMAKESFSLFGTRADLDEIILPNNTNGPSTVN